MRAALALALLCSACATTGPKQADPQAAAESILLSELRNLPDAELVRRVLGPLAPFPYLGHRGELDFHPLHGTARLWFWSRPRAGGHPGVCRTQRLIVSFERVSGAGFRFEDAAVRPSGFDLEDYYIVEDEEEAFGPWSAQERGQHALDTACQRLDPRGGATPAPTGSQLIRALKLVERLGAGAREGEAVAPLDCTRLHWDGDVPSEAECLRALAPLGRQSVHWVEECSPRRTAPGGCVRVLVPDRFIEFDLTSGGEPLRITLEAIEDSREISAL